MRRTLAAIVVVLALLIPGLADAQTNVKGGTGNIRFGLDRYGDFWIYNGSSEAQIDRATILVALDSVHVFDYQNDAYYLITPPALATGGIADTIATALIDNTYPDVPVPPDVRVRENVYAWHNDYFFLVKYSVTNYSSSTYHLYVGMGVIPMPSDSYGGETVGYDATKKVAYFFRSGETPYTGVKVMGQAPYSFHVLDWDVYSPTSGTKDEATDSTRWRMTALPGFDTGLPTAGDNGSFFNLNVGLRNIAAGDSTSFTVAYMYGTSLNGLLAVSDSADKRYARVFTFVERNENLLPTSFSLLQNYPNPFNPSTRIEFQLTETALTTLKVYNIIGEEIATLVNDRLAPGAYHVDFSGMNLSSGVYLYRLQSGSSIQTRYMLLLK